MVSFLVLPGMIRAEISRVQSTATYQSAYASSFTATLGTSPAEDNLLLLIFSVKQTSPTISLPAGFTVLAEDYPENAYVLIAAKLAGSSESSSFNVTTNGVSSGGSLVVCEYTSDNGIDLGEMVAAAAFNSSSITTTTQVSGPLTVPDFADLLIAVVACNNTVSAWSGSWSNSFSGIAAVNGSNSSMAVAERFNVANGSYSTTTGITTARKINGLMVALIEEENSAISVTGVTVTPTALDMNVGDMSELTAAIAPTNATEQGISWTTSNSSVATVDVDGLVTAVASGSATITATTVDGSYTDDSAIVVTSFEVPVIYEDFSSSASNFTVVDGGTWGVSGGRYVLSNPQTFTQNGLLGQVSVHNTVLTGDFDAEAVLRITGTGGDWDDLVFIFNYVDSSNYYYVSLNENSTVDSYTKGLFKVVNDTPTELDDITSTIATGTDYVVGVVRTGSSIVVYLDSVEVASATDSTFSGGRVGFGSKNDGGQFDELQVFGSAESAQTAGSGEGFYNNTFTAQTGSFVTTFTVIPSATPTNAQVALSDGDASGYNDLAAIVRFNDSGNIDARNGSVYQAANTVTYAGTTSYYFRLEVDVINRTYSAYVTPDGGTELTIGEGYAFRTQQASVTSLDTWVAHVDANAPLTLIDVYNFLVTPIVVPGAVATPSFSPSGGTYTSTQNVTITTATSGATIRYTTDGSAPSSTNGTVYSGPVNIGSTATLKAIAYKSGMTDSSVRVETYTITSQVEAPQFSPNGGSYSSTQYVSLSTGTSGATIRYTTDGSTPSSSSGTVYGSTISISNNTTLKAIAYKSGMTDSTVTSAIYSINSTPSSGFPTHPNQTGLSGVGITRSNLPVASSNTFYAADANSVITDVQFTDTVWLRPGANNITFKRCWFRGGGDQSIKSSSTSNMAVNTTFEDCDFGEYGSANWVGSSHLAYLGGTNYIKRCHFYNSADCIKWAGNSVNYIEDSWLQPVHIGDKHTDCMQLDDGVVAKIYAERCTFEKRTFVFSGVTAHSHEELSSGTLTTANVSHWGNATLQSKPCNPAGSCTGPIAAAYFSWVDCLLTGGGYLATIEDQSGAFIDNVVIEGTGGDTDLGLRDAGNMTISGNTFDDGTPYSGVSATGKKTNPNPIPDLGL